eukprot:CAMPEP_0115600706 /NCGR_PEP_ID=MMETSP0272-20121206/15026_1 /TAXON_ID=71861 /ORGANISM="Scrippsiella trochoidea, Strain CCMP3099" /LENGTH=85 /DNA_ID=CAMNT_0003036157 /DNA_START=6 /DNA_END=263 /DNA_ORIENTATION=-
MAARQTFVLEQLLAAKISSSTVLPKSASAAAASSSELSGATLAMSDELCNPAGVSEHASPSSSSTNTLEDALLPKQELMVASALS